MNAQTRLSLNVKAHPSLTAGGDDVPIVGELKIGGTFPVAFDLNHGDELVVTIAGADGEAITRGIVTVAGPPPLIPLESKELGLVGYCRSHKGKVTTAEAMTPPK